MRDMRVCLVVVQEYIHRHMPWDMYMAEDIGKLGLAVCAQADSLAIRKLEKSPCAAAGGAGGGAGAACADCIDISLELLSFCTCAAVLPPLGLATIAARSSGVSSCGEDPDLCVSGAGLAGTGAGAALSGCLGIFSMAMRSGADAACTAGASARVGGDCPSICMMASPASCGGLDDGGAGAAPPMNVGTGSAFGAGELPKAGPAHLLGTSFCPGLALPLAGLALLSALGCPLARGTGSCCPLWSTALGAGICFCAFPGWGGFFLDFLPPPLALC